MTSFNRESSLVFDSVDIDLVVKILSRTAFSPFFTIFIPLTFKAQGAEWTDGVVTQSIAWCIFTILLWFLGFTSKIWKNGGNYLRSPSPLDWGEQIVLITGGASGVGALLANTLAVRNVTVVVLDVEPLVSENYNISSLICDVSNWEDVQKAHRQVVETIGHPTIIVNNAGVVQGKPLLELSPQDLQQTFGVNVVGQFYILKAFLPGMIKRKTGHVVSMASVLGEIGVCQLTDYCASKAAIISLHESVRFELDERYKAPGIRTTLVVPGHIATPLFSSLLMPRNWITRFVAPTLAPHIVVKAIITALDEQFSVTIRLPFYVHLVPWLKLTPSYVIGFGRWLSGSDRAMNKFVKMTGKRIDEATTK